MVNRPKLPTLRELEQLADLIEDAAFCAAADSLWEEIETGAVARVDSRPVLKMAASRQGSAVPVQDRANSTPTKLDAVDVPEGRITIFVGGGRVYVALTSQSTFRATLLVLGGRRLSLGASEVQPDLLEVAGVTPAEIERFLEVYHRSPHDFPIELA